MTVMGKLRQLWEIRDNACFNVRFLISNAEKQYHLISL